jgi:hypothetical protein
MYGYIPLAWRAVRVYLYLNQVVIHTNFCKRAGPLKSFPLMKSRYVYQKGRSTEAALHDLVQKIEGILNQKEFALGYRWSI